MESIVVESHYPSRITIENNRLSKSVEKESSTAKYWSDKGRDDAGGSWSERRSQIVRRDIEVLLCHRPATETGYNDDGTDYDASLAAPSVHTVVPTMGQRSLSDSGGIA